MGNSWSKKAPEQEVSAETETIETVSIQTEVSVASEVVEQNSKRSRGKRKSPNRDRNDSKKAKVDTRRKTARDLQEAGHQSSESNEPREPRVPKKKVALLVGFNGTGYMGMQLNPNAQTIESTIFKALCDAGAISKSNSDDPKKSGWMRCARTDKGVHAAGNVLALKMQIPTDYDVVERINSFLPDQIRVWGYVPVIGSFNPKNLCDSRIYEYLLPTYALMEPAKPEYSDTQLFPDDLVLCNNDPVNPIVKYTRRSTPEQILERHAFRAPEERIKKLRAAMKAFEGSHNFHNYTNGKGARDHSARRYLIEITVSEPMIINKTEWVSIKLHGQSFMLHQIRKMVSMGLLIARSDTPISLIEKTFKHDRVNIPKAPALGLLLEKPLFKVYNDQLIKKSHMDRVKLDFEQYTNTIQSFKEKWIYEKIFETELEENIFDSFLTSVDAHIGNEYDYINPEGTIPEACMIHTKHNAK